MAIELKAVQLPENLALEQRFHIFFTYEVIKFL